MFDSLCFTGTTGSKSASAKSQVLKYAAEVAEVVELKGARGATSRGTPGSSLPSLGELLGRLPVVAKLVVFLPLLRVGKDFKSLVYLFEP